MATARDVATRALRMLMVAGPGEALAAEDGEAALVALNAMLHRFPGLAHTDYTFSSTVTFDDKHLGNVATMLAYEVAPEFGRGVPDVVAREYAGARARFAAQYQYADIDTSLKMSVDSGVLKMPSQFQDGNYRADR